MIICIVSIDHYLQYVEAEADSDTLRASKERLRAILLELLGAGKVGVIFEESSPAKATIAQELAERSGVPWQNISMTKEERVSAGIFEALQNRPGSPDLDDMNFWIEYRIPEDEIREAYFVRRIEEGTESDHKSLVLLGDMHVQEVADALSTRGHRVEIVQELVSKKRWADLREV